MKKVETTLARRTAKGGFWVFTLRVADRLFQLTRTIILASLLSPDDFGIFGMAFLTLSVIETISQTGFRDALIQKKENTEPYLDTAWTIGVIRSLTIALILFLLAPSAANFFKAPDLIKIVKVISLATIFQGFINISVIQFEKEIRFHKYFIYQFSGVMADVIVSIFAAILLRSVWALILGLLAGNLTKCFSSYLIDSYRPRIHLDLKKGKELFKFGKWILSSSILLFIVIHGDDIFVGKLLGIAALGFYQMAYLISNAPATEISHIISQVTFPLYSKIQDNLSRLRSAYQKTLQITAFLSFPAAALIFVMAPDFTRLFLGKKWLPIIPLMQILVISGLTRSIMATTGPVLHAVGKPELETRWQLVRLFTLAIFIYPATVKWGILGTSMAVLASTLVSTAGFCVMVIRITKSKWVDFVKKIIPPFISGLIIILLLSALRTSIKKVDMISFTLLILTGLITLTSITLFFDKFTDYNLILLIKNTLRNFKENKQ